MKILWLVNVPLPEAAQALGLRGAAGGGWIEAQLQTLRASHSMVLVHVTPQVAEPQTVTCAGAVYHVLPAKTKSLADDFRRLLAQECPDVVHVFGTEYAHSDAMVAACEGRCLLYLQGVMAEIARHYRDGLPEKFSRVNPLRQFMGQVYYADSIALAQRSFTQRGVAEQGMLQAVGDVIGRTAFDKAYAVACNPNLQYHHVNESLRKIFYEAPAWKPQNALQHSIFVSQAYYPVKGFHMLLQALPALVRLYPDLTVWVAGQTPYTLNNRLLDTAIDYFFEYQRYIKQLIHKLNLERHIHYMGPLGAEPMCEKYQRSHVFVSASSMENSPNSVGEAMLMGMPIVSTDRGGVSSLLQDGIEGILYDFYDTEALIEGIRRVFDSEDVACEFSKNARKHALQTHDRAANTAQLLAAYAAFVERT